MGFESGNEIRSKVLIDIKTSLSEDDIFHGLEMPGMNGFKPKFSK